MSECEVQIYVTQNEKDPGSSLLSPFLRRGRGTMLCPDVGLCWICSIGGAGTISWGSYLRLGQGAVGVPPAHPAVPRRIAPDVDLVFGSDRSGRELFYLYLGTSREQTVADGKRWVYCLSGTVECDSKLGLRTLPVCTSKNPFPGADGREVKNRAAGQPAARIYYSASFGGWNRTRSAYCCHTQSSLPR